MSLVNDHNHIAEIKALIESGDVSLADERAKYLRKTGKNCPLDDEKLILAIAMTDDDDDDLFVANVDKVAQQS
jgi:hypothetical protein